jgi:Domain of unknown function (DUF4145)
MDEIYPVPITCGHCNTRGYSKILANYECPPQFGDTLLMILECPRCLNHMITMCCGIDWCNVLYPTGRKSISHLPEEVENEYLQAVNSRRLSIEVCVLHIGRTLEAICEHEGITGKKIVKGKETFIPLAERLKELANSGKIPKPLADMADLLKAIRNDGVHYSKDSIINNDDIQTALDFLETILEYLYAAPAKIAELQKKLEKVKEGNGVLPS